MNAARMAIEQALCISDIINPLWRSDYHFRFPLSFRAPSQPPRSPHQSLKSISHIIVPFGPGLAFMQATKENENVFDSTLPAVPDRFSRPPGDCAGANHSLGTTID